jgi:hypothetical protein
LASGKCTKANGPAPNAERRLLNCRLNQMVHDRFTAKPATKPEGKVVAEAVEEDSISQLHVFSIRKNRSKRKQEPLMY